MAGGTAAACGAAPASLLCTSACVCFARTRVVPATWHRRMGWGSRGSRVLICCAKSLGTGEASGGDERAQPTPGCRSPLRQRVHPLLSRSQQEGELCGVSKGRALKRSPPPLPCPPPGEGVPTRTLQQEEPPAGLPPSHQTFYNKNAIQKRNVIFWHSVCAGKKRGVEYFISSSEGENKRLQSQVE